MLTQSSGWCETIASVLLETRESLCGNQFICGFVASRAESLRLSVRQSTRERLRLGRPSRQKSRALDGKRQSRSRAGLNQIGLGCSLFRFQ